MRLLCIIPARLGSTRLAAKPLRLIAGEPLIRHVARRVLGFQLGAEVVVATDHESVADVLADLPVRAVLTRGSHTSGTERVAAVAGRVEYAGADVVLNVQGDEPLVEAEALRGAVQQVAAGADIGTAAGSLAPHAARDPNRVKVSVDGRGRATRFFRVLSFRCPSPQAVFHHIGVYAYRPVSLARWVGLPPVPEEQDERLEQLRPLSHGMTVGVAVLHGAPAPGVDTAGDLEAVEHLLAAPGPRMVG